MVWSQFLSDLVYFRHWAYNVELMNRRLLGCSISRVILAFCLSRYRIIRYHLTLWQFSMWLNLAMAWPLWGGSYVKQQSHSVPLLQGRRNLQLML